MSTARHTASRTTSRLRMAGLGMQPTRTQSGAHPAPGQMSPQQTAARATAATLLRVVPAPRLPPASAARSQPSAAAAMAIMEMVTAMEMVTGTETETGTETGTPMATETETPTAVTRTVSGTLQRPEAMNS